MQPVGGRAFGDQSGYLHSGRHQVPAFGGPGVLSSSGKYADDTASQYSYAPKSKLIYSRKGESSKRSRTGGKSGALRRTGSSTIGPYVEDHETRSRLSKASVQRFNEAIPEAGPRSTTGKSVKSGSVRSKVLSQTALSGKKLGDDQLQQYLSNKGRVNEAPSINAYDDTAAVAAAQKVEEPAAEADPAEEEKDIAAEDIDNVDALPDSISQVKPSPSQISGMSGRTYISQL